MVRTFPCLIAGIILTASCTCLAEELVDGIAAQVGEEVVLYSEVLASVADIEKRMRAAGIQDHEIAKLRADGLERMIEEKIVDSEVRRMELFASEQEVDNAIEMIAIENKITIDQLKESVRSTGLTFQEYRETIKSKIEYQKVVQMALLPKVEIEEGEIKKLYEDRFGDQPDGGVQVHLRQLLIPVSPDLDLETACAQVRAAVERITAGEAFEAVASEVSVVSPERGGDIGWLHAEKLSSWMAALVQELEPGEMSEISRQPFGCTTLKLVERRTFVPVNYEQIENRLYQEIQQVKLEEEFIKWMEDLRETTYIKRRGFFADAANFEDPTSRSPEAPPDSLFQ